MPKNASNSGHDKIYRQVSLFLTRRQLHEFTDGLVPVMQVEAVDSSRYERPGIGKDVNDVAPPDT